MSDLVRQFTRFDMYGVIILRSFIALIVLYFLIMTVLQQAVTWLAEQTCSSIEHGGTGTLFNFMALLAL